MTVLRPGQIEDYYMNPDDTRYKLWQEEQQRKWELACRCCGACCGAAENDPCEHLIQLDNGRYLCTIYNNRFGIHKSKGGREFKCVPIKEILHKSWPGDNRCGYKNEL